MAGTSCSGTLSQGLDCGYGVLEIRSLRVLWVQQQDPKSSQHKDMRREEILALKLEQGGQTLRSWENGLLQL